MRAISGRMVVAVNSRTSAPCHMNMQNASEIKDDNMTVTDGRAELRAWLLALGTIIAVALLYCICLLLPYR